MRIAILGATSQIAKDLICSFGEEDPQIELLLYARDIPYVENWLQRVGLQKNRYKVNDYTEYGIEPHDVVINFVGVGDPRRAAEMGASIFDVTMKFDDLVLEHLRLNPERRYLFISSGAAYGNAFGEPVNEGSSAQIDINNIKPQDYYSVAKLYAEVRHRSYSDLAITDLRVFNYFSRTQDITARFFITDILRAIRNNQMLCASSDFMVRDFIHPSDFFDLINCILKAEPSNNIVECYSREPIDKLTLLNNMKNQFGLKYKIQDSKSLAVNATNAKAYYYSVNHKAAEFGYTPQFTSWEGIKTEVEAILNA